MHQIHISDPGQGSLVPCQHLFEHAGSIKHFPGLVELDIFLDLGLDPASPEIEEKNLLSVPHGILRV